MGGGSENLLEYHDIVGKKILYCDTHMKYKKYGQWGGGGFKPHDPPPREYATECLYSYMSAFS